jgi:methionyl-tRNA formyltransferase
VFAGTPDFSADILTALINADYQIVAAYCQPDRRVGRGKKLVFGPVKQLATENNIPVEQPIKFDQTTNQDGLTPLQVLEHYRADLMVVVAYGLILPQAVLDAPRYGCVNIHASILPRWRGAAPIQRAIEYGDQQTGITIMQMDKGLDTGNMLLKTTCAITSQDTGASLHDKLANIGSESIVKFLASYRDGLASELSPGEVQQDNLASYAHKLTKQEAAVDWSMPAKLIEQKIRAFNSWPVSFTHVDGHRLRIWQAENIENKGESEPVSVPGKVVSFDKHGIVVLCGDGELLRLLLLQADGSRAMAVADLLNSKRHWFELLPVLE